MSESADWLPLVTRYYDACSNADLEGLMSVLHPEVVHWFLAPNIGSTAVRGNEHLARYWRKVATMLRAPIIPARGGGCAGRLAARRSKVIRYRPLFEPPIHTRHRMKLFESYALGSLTLQNRMVMAPMTRSRATERNTPNTLMAEYYRQRAEAGLIITEGTSPSPNGLGYARIPGLFRSEEHTSELQSH